MLDRDRVSHRSVGAELSPGTAAGRVVQWLHVLRKCVRCSTANRDASWHTSGLAVPTANSSSSRRNVTLHRPRVLRDKSHVDAPSDEM